MRLIRFFFFFLVVSASFLLRKIFASLLPVAKICVKVEISVGKNQRC
ncbi:unnamed protein product [Larinioides sclopetarius]|uniref:Uncharacterized protein n=1 Tax=Larinioides sclopetarius TaxID=280406 RepID=A0AAV2ATY2_9ARAC